MAVGGDGALRVARSARRITRLPKLVRDLGGRGALRYIASQLGIALRGPLRPLALPKIDLFESYDFIVRGTELTSPPPTMSKAMEPLAPPRTLNWVIPDFTAGSGGHMTIFRMIGQLERLGFDNRIAIVGDSHFSGGGEAQAFIREHFQPLKASVSLGETSLQPAEFTVATEWRTAYAVRRFTATRHKLYFIQDFEPHFFSHGSHYAFAEATYRFGFIGLTVGDWLAQRVRRDYGMEAYAFQMGCPEDYHQRPRTVPNDNIPRVFFYARHVTPRRGFELGLLALAQVHRALPQAEFVLAGWDVSDYHIPFPHLNAGVVPHAELAALYSQCDAALVLSLTNLSLLPIELMACGCPVVSNRGPNVEWQLSHEHNALLADASPEDLAAALLRLLADQPLRQRLRDNGLQFARAASWDDQGQTVAKHLQQIRSRQDDINAVPKPPLAPVPAGE